MAFYYLSLILIELFKILVLICSMFTLTACSIKNSCQCGCSSSKHISVFNEPIDQDRLASVHVNAPDPLHEVNAHGQKLHVSWKIPKIYEGANLNGVLKIRFNTPEQVTIPFEICSLKGSMTYELLNEEYFSKQGIGAYQIQIFSDGVPIDTYQHSMWADLILIDPS